MSDSHDGGPFAGYAQPMSPMPQDSDADSLAEFIDDEEHDEEPPLAQPEPEEDAPAPAPEPAPEPEADAPEAGRDPMALVTWCATEHARRLKELVADMSHTSERVEVSAFCRDYGCSMAQVLQCAVQVNRDDLVKYVLTYEKDALDDLIGVHKHRRVSLLHVAVHNQAMESMEILLEHDADPNFGEGSGHGTALHVAMARDLYRHRITQLLDHGANPNARTSQATGALTPTHAALKHCHFDATFLLHGSPFTDVDARDARGNTALHYAVRLHTSSDSFKGVHDVRPLLQYGADVSLRNDDGYTALDVFMRDFSWSHLTLMGNREWWWEDVCTIADGLLMHPNSSINADLYEDSIGEAARSDTHRAGPGPKGRLYAMFTMKTMAQERSEFRRCARLAFAMGLHERLGNGSVVRSLDAGLVHFILTKFL